MKKAIIIPVCIAGIAATAALTVLVLCKRKKKQQTVSAG